MSEKPSQIERDVDLESAKLQERDDCMGESATALRSLERPAGPTTNQLPIEHQISSSAPACRVVPEEPTEDMIAPGEALIQGVIECVQKDRWFDTFATARNIYKAMLAAAPPSGERKEEE